MQKETQKTRHSPAPFRVSRGNGKGELPIYDAANREIGCIRGSGKLGDAKLFQAAPDLLEACKRLLIAAESSDGCEGGDSPFDADYRMARAAIAKAS